MQYILTGFSHEMAFRIFDFQGIDAHRMRTYFSVKADLGLLRRYGIPVQEAALLCRGILERRDEADERRNFTYAESDMRARADACAIEGATAKVRKAPRRGPREKLETAWRGPRTSVART